MDTLLSKVWAQIEPHVFITKREYLAGLEGWKVSPFEREGALLGAAITKGPEFHFVTFGGRWNLTRADIRSWLKPILDEYGCVTTKTPKDDTRQQRFNRLLGFVPEGEDEFFVHMRLTKLRHVGD